MKTKKSGSGVVYSTEVGSLCPACGSPSVKCVCKTKGSVPKSDGIVRLCRETKGRKGRGVTLIKGIPLDNSGLKKIAKSLKQKCGSGGSVKNGVIEIQGDHREMLAKELTGQGFKVKLAGG